MVETVPLKKVKYTTRSKQFPSKKSNIPHSRNSSPQKSQIYHTVETVPLKKETRKVLKTKAKFKFK